MRNTHAYELWARLQVPTVWAGRVHGPFQVRMFTRMVDAYVYTNLHKCIYIWMYNSVQHTGVYRPMQKHINTHIFYR